MAMEVQPFGIRVLLVEPGAFRTNFLSPNAMTMTPVSETYKGTVVEQVSKMFVDMEGKQKGDVEKGVERMYEVIMGEGMGKGKEAYLRCLIGKDCYDRGKQALEKKLENVEAMKEIAESTDIVE